MCFECFWETCEGNVSTVIRPSLRDRFAPTAPGLIAVMTEDRDPGRRGEDRLRVWREISWFDLLAHERSVHDGRVGAAFDRDGVARL